MPLKSRGHRERYISAYDTPSSAPSKADFVHIAAAARALATVLRFAGIVSRSPDISSSSWSLQTNAEARLAILTQMASTETPATLTVFYPSTVADSSFDTNYYVSKHMDLVVKVWEPMGLKSWQVIEFEAGSLRFEDNRVPLSCF